MIKENEILTYKETALKEIIAKNEILREAKLEELNHKKSQEYDAFCLKESDEHKRENYLHNLDNKYKDKFNRYNKRLLRKEKAVERKADNYVKEVKQASKRVFEVDLLRGIIIIGMVIDHLIFDFADRGVFKSIVDFHNFETPGLHFFQYINDFCTNFYDSDVRMSIRMLGIFGLFLLTGISSHFSKGNIRRSLIIFVVGLGMVIATNIFALVSHNYVHFTVIGTIECIGICLFIYHGSRLLYITIYNAIKRKIHKVKLLDGDYINDESPKSWAYIALGFSVTGLIIWFFIARNTYLNSPVTAFEVMHGLTDVPTHTEAQFWQYAFLIFHGDGNHVNWYFLSDSMFFTDYGLEFFVKVFFGYTGFGADWLGIFPWLPFLYFGGFVGETLYHDKKSIIYLFFPKEERLIANPFDSKAGQLNMSLNLKFRFITQPGKHTFLVYIFHQPVLFIIFIPIFLLFGATLKGFVI